MKRLEGKVAIVTGAGSGIGRATAMAMAKEGARVVVADYRPDDAGQKVVDEIKKADGQAIFARADVSDAKSVENLIQLAVKTFGKLDVLVNNAGVVRMKKIENLTEEDFNFMVNTNFKGVWLMCKYAVPEMKKAGKGSIVNLSSITAEQCQTGSSVYGATKGAVLSMSINLAVELAPYNIRVNAVLPGVIVSGMNDVFSIKHPEWKERIEKETPLQHRLGTPEEVAALIVFLASDESGFITGQKMAVDGGIQADSHIA
jgi:3-oxoacyl-[acyl-carrier protein] reductase